MRALFILVILSKVFPVFSQTVIERCPKSTVYDFVTGASITAPFKGVDTGHSIVLRYQEVYDCPDMYDEEIIIRMIWAIPDTVTFFQLRVDLDSTDTTFTPFDCVLHRGAWGYYMTPKTAHGNITVTKVKKGWQADGAVDVIFFGKRDSATLNHTLRFSGDFVPWKIRKRKRKRDLMLFSY